MKSIHIEIRVPDGEFCWDFRDINADSCEHFDNEGGHARCTLSHLLSYQSPKRTDNGYLKLGRCQIADEVDS